jgi:hypothetical protein
MGHETESQSKKVNQQAEAKRGTADPEASRSLGPGGRLAELQRLLGNRGVLGLLAAGQPKLEVGPAADSFEREADAAANQVVSRLRGGAGSVEGAPGPGNLGRSGHPAAIQRKLIPKVDEAFNAAIVLNPTDFTPRKQNTDDEATTSEQENLARVHGRAHKSAGDTAEEKTIASLVRAVVLGEFSDRLVALKTATDEGGTPLSDAAKKRKRAVYNQKADEFRKKQAPLVAAGMAAPETQAFLREYGFGDAIQPSKRAVADARSGGARIDVRSTFIGAQILGMRMRSHLFIVYTSKEGRQVYFRGGSDDAGMTVTDLGDYTPDTVDWDPSAPSVTVLEGEAAEAKLDKLLEATRVINGMQVPYQGVIAKEFGGNKPNIIQKGLNYAAMGLASEGENCNATAWTILTRAGVPTKKPDGHHPGWGSVLGSQTQGKENALPAAETDTAKPTPYTIDEHRDAADDRGLVQIYWDRGLFEPATKVAVGTKVTLLKDENSWTRKISFGGQVGYIRRTDRDALMMQMVQWRTWMTDNVSDEDLVALDEGTDPSVQDILDDLEENQGIPPDVATGLAQQIFRATNITAQIYVQNRINELGEAGARLLIKDPYELRHLVQVSGATRKEVLAAIRVKLKAINEKEKVRAALLDQSDDPLAADMVVNELPEYPTVQAIATEVGMTWNEVFHVINEFRAPARQAIYLRDLMEAAIDSDTLGDLDAPDASIVADWAAQLGLPDAFIRDRLREVAKLLAAEEAKAQAEAKAQEEAKKKAMAKKKKRTKAKAQKAKQAPATALEPGEVAEQ